MDLAISNVINVSVATPQTGVGEYNTSNLAIFTEEPYQSSFGDDGYKIYLSPTEVATDFGTDSKTYAMALGVFSQQPNILAGGGYLVVIPFITAVHDFVLTGVPASGSFTLTFTQGATAAIDWDDTASEIQTKVRVISGFESAVVTGSLASQSFSIAFTGYYGAVALPTVGGAGLQTSAPAAITITPSADAVGEDVAAAITRTVGLVQYFAGMGTKVFTEADMLEAAAVVQALNKLFFFTSFTEADVDEGGMLDLLATGSFTKSRAVPYFDDLDTALVYMASYAGSGLSVDFTGSNTTKTMHLKTLNGVQPDPSMTQTLLQKCKDAGADVYVSIQGVPKVFTSGENTFFDRMYNLLAFVGDLEVSGFNVLAQTSTKIPQTETGMDVLKGAYRKVCEKYVSNQYLAPGQWTDPTTFGNQENFFLNLEQRGYYIYSAPLSAQLPAARAARSAPLVQIAIKEAGAMHSGNVIVNVNP